MVRSLFLPFLFLAFLPGGAAQAQLISPQPLCLTVQNDTDIDMIAHVETVLYTAPDGTMTQHDVNLGLAPGKARETCSTGPFFEGFRLRVVARTTVPQYSCLSGMGRTVVISSTRDDEGQRVITMDCLREGRVRPVAP